MSDPTNPLAVVKTALILNEQDEGKGKEGSFEVPVTLEKGEPVDGNYYKGNLIYEDPSENGKKKCIDVIIASFSAESNLDKVDLLVTYKDVDPNKSHFTGIATTEPTGGTAFRLVHQTLREDGKLLLSFIQPSVGETTGFNQMFFHVPGAVIDPEVEVDRSPQ